MKIAVLVNGSSDKTNGVRVRALFRDLEQDHDVTFHYRDDTRKLSSTFNFCRRVFQLTPDIVYVEGFGYAGIVAAGLAKALCGSRFVLSTGDDAYAFAKSCMNAIKAQAVGVFEFVTLRLADAIVVWGQYHQLLLQNKGLKNVHWIPGGVDTSLFSPMNVESLRTSLGVENAITIGVVGSINWNSRHSYCYGWEILEVLRELKGHPVVGLIIGMGDGTANLKEAAHRYGVENQVIFLGWVDHDVLPQYINAIDVCVSTQSNDLVGKVRITAKVPEYLACGRYTITTDSSGAADFVRGCGLVLPYEGVKDNQYVRLIVENIRTLLKDPSGLAIGNAGVQIARRYFDYTVLRPQLHRVIQLLSTES